MKLLNQLKLVLSEIEENDEWEYEFVQNLIIRKEENPSITLTKKQFKKLCQIHTKYCHGR